MFAKFNNQSPFASLDLKLEEIENSMTVEELTKSELTIRVVAIMFTEKGEYGKSAFIVGAGTLSNDSLFTMWLPSHQVKTCEAIVSDEEAVSEILSGKCGLKGREYIDKKKIKRFTVEWCDL